MKHGASKQKQFCNSIIIRRWMSFGDSRSSRGVSGTRIVIFSISQTPWQTHLAGHNGNLLQHFRLHELRLRIRMECSVHWQHKRRSRHAKLLRHAKQLDLGEFRDTKILSIHYIFCVLFTNFYDTLFFKIIISKFAY